MNTSMKNDKKGIVLSFGLLLSFAVALIVLILGLTFGIAILFSTKLLFYAIGVGGLVLTLIYVASATVRGKVDGKKIILVISLIGIFALFIFLPAFGFVSQTAFLTPSGEIVQLAIPHYASFKCDVVGEQTGITRVIPQEGLFINSENVGFNARSITNIRVDIFQTVFSSVFHDVRLGYQLCNPTGSTCNSMSYVTYTTAGVKNVPISSVDLTTSSIKFVFERRLLLGAWQPYSGSSAGAVISYDADVYGLTLSSTTQDPAGAVICSTSCDLSCPQQGVRQKLVSTEKNVLGFLETAPYLEYWESIDYNLNAQGGATIYNDESNTFCLAGNVYNAGEVTLENGRTYIYPETATRQVKECCPGAVIRGTTEDKICQNDYTFKTISKSTAISCMSDIQCPGGGQVSVQQSGTEYVSSYWSCRNSQCVQSTPREVECLPPDTGCAVDQICDAQTFQCVGGSVIAPVRTVPATPISETQCLDKATRLPFMGYRYISEQTTIEPSFVDKTKYYLTFGLAGTNKPTTNISSRCESQFGPYYIGILIVIVVFVLAAVTIKFFNKRKRK